MPEPAATRAASALVPFCKSSKKKKKQNNAVLANRTLRDTLKAVYKVYITHIATLEKKKLTGVVKRIAGQPGYQRLFLACDEELRRPHADTS